MIVGKMKDLASCKGLTKNLDAAIDYVLNNDLLALPLGKTLVNDNMFVMRESYVAKNVADCTIESHDNYIDLQLVLSGKEAFGYCDRTNPSLTVKEAYDEARDITKYNCSEGVSYIELDNCFFIAFPNDVHVPKVKNNDGTIEKAIVKVKVE